MRGNSVDKRERKRKPRPNQPVMPYQEPHAAARGRRQAAGRGDRPRGQAFREKLGLTITELAKAAGHVGRHAVQDRKRRHLALASSLQALSRALHVPVTALLPRL